MRQKPCKKINRNCHSLKSLKKGWNWLSYGFWTEQWFPDSLGVNWPQGNASHSRSHLGASSWCCLSLSCIWLTCKMIVGSNFGSQLLIYITTLHKISCKKKLLVEIHHCLISFGVFQCESQRFSAEESGRRSTRGFFLLSKMSATCIHREDYEMSVVIIDGRQET